MNSPTISIILARHRGAHRNLGISEAKAGEFKFLGHLELSLKTPFKKKKKKDRKMDKKNKFKSTVLILGQT